MTLIIVNCEICNTQLTDITMILCSNCSKTISRQGLCDFCERPLTTKHKCPVLCDCYTWCTPEQLDTAYEITYDDIVNSNPNQHDEDCLFWQQYAVEKYEE